MKGYDGKILGDPVSGVGGLAGAGFEAAGVLGF